MPSNLDRFNILRRTLACFARAQKQRTIFLNLKYAKNQTLPRSEIAGKTGMFRWHLVFLRWSIVITLALLLPRTQCPHETGSLHMSICIFYFRSDISSPKFQLVYPLYKVMVIYRGFGVYFQLSGQVSSRRRIFRNMLYIGLTVT